MDVSIQLQILDLSIDLKGAFQVLYFFITHGLAAITSLCDRVLFFKDGAVIEDVDNLQGLEHVRDEYSLNLFSAAKAMMLLAATEILTR